MRINFITSNINKVREFKMVLEPKIKVSHNEHEYKELRSDDPREIAEEAAQRLANELKKAVVVEDSGLFIGALKDFPGTCSKYIHQRIGLAGLLRLLEKKEDRIAWYKSAVAYCEPGKKPVSFLGEEKGTISKKSRGNFGFGHDPIFIPEGSKKTYGEMEDAFEKKKFRKRAVLQLKGFLVDKKSKK